MIDARRPPSSWVDLKYGGGALLPATLALSPSGTGDLVHRHSWINPFVCAIICIFGLLFRTGETEWPRTGCQRAIGGFSLVCWRRDSRLGCKHCPFSVNVSRPALAFYRHGRVPFWQARHGRWPVLLSSAPFPNPSRAGLLCAKWLPSLHPALPARRWWLTSPAVPRDAVPLPLRRVPPWRLSAVLPLSMATSGCCAGRTEAGYRKPTHDVC